LDGVDLHREHGKTCPFDRDQPSLEITDSRSHRQKLDPEIHPAAIVAGGQHLATKRWCPRAFALSKLAIRAGAAP
jgi:hypothetical protein